MIRITVDIEHDGTPVIWVEGAKGNDCYKLTESLEKLGKVIDDKKTPEYYQQPQENLNKAIR